MNIVIEGTDSSGKSTLAHYLATRLGRQIMPSEGPEKYEGEMKKRVDRYLTLNDMIFDRHPCVSHEIYRQFQGAPALDREMIGYFYNTNPLLIWCKDHGLPTNQTHVGIDTSEHVRLITENHDKIAALYREWAIDFAHICYRIGNSLEQVHRMTRGVI